MKDIDEAKSIWWSGYQMLGLKQAKKMHFWCFFACLRPYIRPPDNHLGWATRMSLASIYPTNSTQGPITIIIVNLIIVSFKKYLFCFLTMKNYVIEWRDTSLMISLVSSKFWGPMLLHFKKSNEILETWSPLCKHIAF